MASASTLTATLQTQPQHGTVSLQSNGTFVYTHNRR
ncbi:MAG: VCBS domain-containing protein [Caldilineaceae bacterium]|nr:VCBS domain-containing protein [Caldilineaceae bacterium]